ncbi:hypothetical protein [Klebsiella pneumoniae]|uniref:hypothetical protein n=1 Tax=Klebsiella pneumoniae TaxID=573 RepID=UPI000E2A51C3|nr:hypothetical protein [Klebsiella pneumoniae]MBF7849630.1 hypothetical protein [Klebsiella pneumoniae]MBV1997762.1 hypothetical protein [Klebsiella pneumoniae]SVQ31956.1 Uncharacterised protein [Klebsiella pneumoniae]HBR3802244.1 hypothetical protein [Klebsiella pneumoniae]HBW8908347.1 hypothetical protein [Klebsiella pneumoniae]
MSKYRELLKEATQLKRKKEFDAACEKLKEAYSHRGGEYWTIAESLRLPTYLQLAGRRKEALQAFNDLLLQNKYISQSGSTFNQSVDANGMVSAGINFNLNTGTLGVIHKSISAFYGEEFDVENQLLHYCVAYVFEVISKIELIQSMYKMADDYPLLINEVTGGNDELRALNLKVEENRNKEMPAHTYTSKGNPVRDVAFPHSREFVLKKTNVDNVIDEIDLLSRRCGLVDIHIEQLAEKIINSIDKADLHTDTWIKDIKDVILEKS